MSAQISAARIVGVAREWLDTPYHHQASLPGVGCDCVGLLRGVFRDLYMIEAEIGDPYSGDWAETTGQERLLFGLRGHLVERVPDSGIHAIKPGDVLVFRMRDTALATHVAIATGPDTMIHSAEGRPVTEVAILSWWRRRLVAVFEFPASSPRT